MPEDIQVLIGAALAVAVLSYLIGDNPLYRLAMHVLVGVGAAYAVGVAISQVLYPAVALRVAGGALSDRTIGLFGLLGCVFLLAKVFRRSAWLGNAAVGYLIGVGAGVAIGGALFGTLVPQTLSAATSLAAPVAGLDAAGSLLFNVLALVATLTALIAFAYSRAARRGLTGAIAGLGRGFLHVAFGATFGLVFIAGASVLSGWVRDLYVLLERLTTGG
jgi:hypothetical protein